MMKFVYHCLNTLFGATIFFGLLYSALVINGVYWKIGPCVKLPNGVIVAHEAYMNFARPYFSPNVVVKGPDGTVFSLGNHGTFHFSETTAWWMDFSRRRFEGPEGVAYRFDVGLVRSWENPHLYERLRREAGPPLEANMKASDPYIMDVLHVLRTHPRYRTRDCGISLFSFSES